MTNTADYGPATNRWYIEYKNFQGVHVPDANSYPTQRAAINRILSMPPRVLDLGKPHVWMMPR